MRWGPVTPPPHEEVPSPASGLDSDVPRPKLPFSGGPDPGPLHVFTPTRDAKAGPSTFSTGGRITSRRTNSNPGESHQLRNGKQVNLTMITGPGAGMSLNTPNTLTQPALHITHSLLEPGPNPNVHISY